MNLQQRDMLNWPQGYAPKSIDMKTDLNGSTVFVLSLRIWESGLSTRRNPLTDVQTPWEEPWNAHPPHQTPGQVRAHPPHPTPGQVRANLIWHASVEPVALMPSHLTDPFQKLCSGFVLSFNICGAVLLVGLTGICSDIIQCVLVVCVCVVFDLEIKEKSCASIYVWHLNLKWTIPIRSTSFITWHKTSYCRFFHQPPVCCMTVHNV